MTKFNLKITYKIVFTSMLWSEHCCCSTVCNCDKLKIVKVFTFIIARNLSLPDCQFSVSNVPYRPSPGLELNWFTVLSSILDKFCYHFFLDNKWYLFAHHTILDTVHVTVKIPLYSNIVLKNCLEFFFFSSDNLSSISSNKSSSFINQHLAKHMKQ